MKRLDARKDLALRKKFDSPVRLDKQAILSNSSTEDKTGWLGRWLATHFGAVKLSADEFLYYGLQRATLSAEIRARYLGKRQQYVLHNKCIHVYWYATAHKKYLLHTILTGAQVPHPELQHAALKTAYGATKRQGPVSTDSLIAFFSSQAVFHVFGKPIEGMYSIGAMRINGYADGSVDIEGFGALTVDALQHYISDIDNAGYLFQELLLPPEYWVEQFGQNYLR